MSTMQLLVKKTALRNANQDEVLVENLGSQAEILYSQEVARVLRIVFHLGQKLLFLFFPSNKYFYSFHEFPSAHLLANTVNIHYSIPSSI